ncbi:hypothetical protein ACIQLJ_02060 [Microbacterium sp. NPDC091313]
MADPTDIDRRAAGLRSAYARQVPVGIGLGAALAAVTGIIAAALGGSTNPAVAGALYGAAGAVVATIAAGAGFLASTVAHEIHPRPWVRVVAAAAASGLVVTAGAALASAAFLTPPRETAPWAGLAAAAVGVGCALGAERRADRVPPPPPRDAALPAAAIWPVFGGAFGIVLAGFALGLVRDQLHIGCTLGAPGTEGAGSWACQDGIGYLFAAIALGATCVFSAVAGALIAGLVRRTQVAVPALGSIAIVAAAAAIALTVQATAAWAGDGDRSGYWLAAVGPSALTAGVSLVGAAVLAWAPRRLRQPGLYAAAGVMALAALMQPGLALGILPAAGCLLAAAIRVGTAASVSRETAAVADEPSSPDPAAPAVPSGPRTAARELPYGPRTAAPEVPVPAVPTTPERARWGVPAWLVTSEPVLWTAAVAIGLLAWVAAIPRLLNGAGCAEICRTDLLDAGSLTLTAGALTVLAAAAVAAIVLHRMRRGRAWASAAAIALVATTALSGTIAIEAGLAPGRAAEITAEQPTEPAPVPSGLHPQPVQADETPRDPTGTWAVPGAGAYVRIDAGGGLALSDGCVEAVGSWSPDADGIAVFTLPEPPASCEPTGSWVLLARSGWAREGWIALRDADGADIGGLPRSD